MILILRIITAIIVLQTLRYKFTGHPESKKIFKKVKLLGLPEQYGRIGTGILELVFGILILVPQTVIIGSIGIAGLMVGALMSHITKLGFKGNYFPLAMSALFALILSIIIVVLEKHLL